MLVFQILDIIFTLYLKYGIINVTFGALASLLLVDTNNFTAERQKGTQSMKGKNKCRILKEIRAEIARANDIEWVTENCTFKGECRGSCPKCEAEVRKLERALEAKRRLGKAVALTGLCAGLITSGTSCGIEDLLNDSQLKGDIPAINNTDTVDEGGTQTVNGTDNGNIFSGDIMGDVVEPEIDDTEMGELPESGENESEESIFELLGDIVAYSADNFASTEVVKYRALESIYLVGFIDTEYADDTDFTIPAGEIFDLVGKSDDYDMYMISYGGQLFGCDISGFEYISTKAE